MTPTFDKSASIHIFNLNRQTIDPQIIKLSKKHFLVLWESEKTKHTSRISHTFRLFQPVDLTQTHQIQITLYTQIAYNLVLQTQ